MFPSLAKISRRSNSVLSLKSMLGARAEITASLNLKGFAVDAITVGVLSPVLLR